MNVGMKAQGCTESCVGKEATINQGMYKCCFKNQFMPGQDKLMPAGDDTQPERGSIFSNFSAHANGKRRGASADPWVESERSR